MPDALKQEQTEQPLQARDDEAPRLRLLVKCEWSSEDEIGDGVHDDVNANRPHEEDEEVMHKR